MIGCWRAAPARPVAIVVAAFSLIAMLACRQTPPPKTVQLTGPDSRDQAGTNEVRRQA